MTKAEQARLWAWRFNVLQQAGGASRNISRTCRHFGISQQAYYRWKRRYDAHGEVGMWDRPRQARRTNHEQPRKISQSAAEVVSRSPRHKGQQRFRLGHVICLSVWHVSQKVRPEEQHDDRQSDRQRAAAQERRFQAVVRGVQRQIATALHRDAYLNAKRIKVTVSGTTAVLNGTVGTFRQREAAETAAAHAPGISHVENRLTVEPAVNAPPDDLDEMC